MDAIIELIDTMDDLIAEFQIDSNGLIEKNFKVKLPIGTPLDPRVRQLLGMLAVYAPTSAEHSIYPIETISYHPADGLTYVNPTMVVVYKMAPPQEIKDQYGIPEGNFLPGFAVKYDLADGSSMAKMADLDYKDYPLPTLPLFTKVGYQFGVGVHFSKDKPELQKYVDFYVASKWRFFMRRHFKELYPDFHEDFKPKWRAYAICVDKDLDEVVKLKRYIYWKDKTLKNLDLA